LSLDPLVPASPVAPELRRIFETIDWRRVAITLAALAVLRAGAAIPLPGLDLDEAGAMAVNLPMSPERFSLMALSTVPWLSAALMFELAILLIPSSSRWRTVHAGHVDPFDPWVLCVAFAFAAYQSSAVVQAYLSLDGLVVGNGMLPPLAIMGGMIGGVAVTIACARIIDRFGIGDGFWAVIGTQSVFAVADGVGGWLGSFGPGVHTFGTAFFDIALFAACILVPVFLFRAMKASGRNDIGDIAWPAIVASLAAGWIVPLLAIAFPQLYTPNMRGTFAPSDVVWIVTVSCIQALFLWIALGRANARGLVLPALAALFLVTSVPLIWSWTVGYDFVLLHSFGSPGGFVALIGLLAFLIPETGKA
jgi:hypothetical protein